MPCLEVFSPALSPQNDLPASTPASKSCASSPPEDASTPGPSSASHLRQLAAKPAPSTDSIGEHLLVPPFWGVLENSVCGGGWGVRQEVWIPARTVPCLFHDSELDATSLWSSAFLLSWPDVGGGNRCPEMGSDLLRGFSPVHWKDKLWS